MQNFEFDTMEQPVSVPADEKTLSAVFRLSPMEAKFLKVLLKSDWVGKEDLPPVQYSIRQVIYTLRKKIEQVQKGIWIINDLQGRYSIPDPGKKHLFEALQRAITLEE